MMKISRPIPWLAVFCVANFCQAQPMFRGDANHSGVYSGPEPHQFHRVKWKFPTGNRIVSSPVIQGKTIYFGSDDGNIYAIDAESGRQMWKCVTKGAVSSTPAVANGVVYATSYDGKLYAVDAVSGELKWKFKTGDVIHASPAYSDGLIYFGSWDSYFYAVDAANGKERWRFHGGEDPLIHNQVGFQSSPAVVNGVV